jgi:hypothetical protein
MMAGIDSSDGGGGAADAVDVDTATDGSVGRAGEPLDAALPHVVEAAMRDHNGRGTDANVHAFSDSDPALHATTAPLAPLEEGEKGSQETHRVSAPKPENWYRVSSD